MSHNLRLFVLLLHLPETLRALPVPANNKKSVINMVECTDQAWQCSIPKGAFKFDNTSQPGITFLFNFELTFPGYQSVPWSAETRDKLSDLMSIECEQQDSGTTEYLHRCMADTVEDARDKCHCNVRFMQMRERDFPTHIECIISAEKAGKTLSLSINNEIKVSPGNMILSMITCGFGRIPAWSMIVIFSSACVVCVVVLVDVILFVGGCCTVPSELPQRSSVWFTTSTEAFGVWNKDDEEDKREDQEVEEEIEFVEETEDAVVEQADEVQQDDDARLQREIMGVEHDLTVINKRHEFTGQFTPKRMPKETDPEKSNYELSQIIGKYDVS